METKKKKRRANKEIKLEMRAGYIGIQKDPAAWFEGFWEACDLTEKAGENDGKKGVKLAAARIDKNERKMGAKVHFKARRHRTRQEEPSRRDCSSA